MPARQTLRFYERDSAWLCLNPAVPSWLVTNRAGVLLLRSVDGRRSVAALWAWLQDNRVPIGHAEVLRLFEAAREVGLFAAGHAGLGNGPWDERRLTAMHVHLTDRCQLECSYCVRRSHPRIPIRTPAERFQQMLRYVKPFSAEGIRLTITGGEPLIFPGFEDVVRTATELGYHKSVLTNAIAINPPRARFLADHIDYIKISVDGPDEETHAATRGAGHFERVLRNVALLRECGLEPNVQVTVSRANLDRCVELLTELDGVNVVFTPVMPMGRGDATRSEFIDDDEFLALSRKIFEVKSARVPVPAPSLTDRDPGPPSSSAYTPGEQQRGCHAGLSNLSVADDGSVYPCHLFQYDRFRLGNIFRDRFEDIFFGQPLREYVDSMDVEANNPLCRTCDVRFLCGGGCKANALHAFGDHRGVDQFCSYLKGNVIDELFRGCTGEPPSARAEVRA